jgi:hypothetical protein
MKGYLSGPMLGYRDLNYPLFAAWAKELRRRGHEVLVPSENPAPPEGEENPIAYYMRLDLQMVMESECLWMIPGWQYSKGAKVEAAVAMAIGVPLLDVDTEKPLPIRRIHEVIDCDHQGWTAGTEGIQVIGAAGVPVAYDYCTICGRYPIYDDKFRIDAI